jgi:hypothetical protein
MKSFLSLVMSSPNLGVKPSLSPKAKDVSKIFPPASLPLRSIEVSSILSSSSLANIERLSPAWIPKDDPKILTRQQYEALLKEKRREFVHTHFGEQLYETFAKMRKDAEQSKPCHQEITFQIPQHFDIDFMEVMLCSYFSDLGYKSLTEPRKDISTKIIITLT